MSTTPASSTKNHHSTKIADELSHILADTYILYLKTQNFHWNVTGPNFHSLHLMFEEQYNQLADAVDVIAERIRALHVATPASFHNFLKLASLKEENGVPSSKDMIKQLLKDHQILVSQAYDSLAKSQQAGDEGTADLLINRIREHEKTAWMLKSCLE